jgi:mRNA-degrading endonuclease RelE of RelBE toxin-antitoxin system
MLKSRLVKVIIVALGTLLITVILNWLQYTVILGLFAGLLGWCTWEQSETTHQLLQKAHIENQLNGELQTENTQLQRELKDIQARSQQLITQLQSERDTRTKLEQKTQELTEQLRSLEATNQAYQAKVSKLEAHVSKSQSLHQEINQQDEYISLMHEEIKQEQNKRQEAEALTESYFNQIQILSAENISLRESLGQANRKLEASRIEQASFSDEDSEIEKISGQYNLKFEYLGDFEDLPDREYKKIMGKILMLQTEPRPHDCDYLRKFLHRHGKVYRVRMGDYRICYVIEDSPSKQIRVLMVDNRNERIYDERLSRRLS